MCGRFAQYGSRDDYFESIGLKTDEITFDPEPLGRYNVAPGTKVLLLNEQDDELRLDPVYWGYGPEWWDKQPLFFAAIGKHPFGQDHDKEGFVIVTSSSNQGMVDIHDRRPLVITADAVRESLSAGTTPQRAEEIALDAAVPEKDFTWDPVINKVGNIHNQGKELIQGPVWISKIIVR